MATKVDLPGLADNRDSVVSLATVLDLVRATGSTTRSELSRTSGLGRSVVTQRLGTLLDAGLVEEGAFAASTGGRMPREVRFRSGAGRLVAAHLGATGFIVGISDLAGQLLDWRSEEHSISHGPESVLGRVEAITDELLKGTGDETTPVWGIGIGLPGPVEYASGRPISPPIMPGWDGYPVRDRLASRFNAPAWVDNDVNVMALGEMKSGVAVGHADILFVKIGTGIGAGIVSRGRLHRGAQGVAGDIGHIEADPESGILCGCGQTGCLEALAGGWAIARDGTAMALNGMSTMLSNRLSAKEIITARDVADAAGRGDPVAVKLLSQAGRRVGHVVATLISAINPSIIVFGGRVADSGDLVLAAVRQVIYARALPLATRDLRITTSALGAQGGLIGCAHLALDELFAPAMLSRWIEAGSPAGRANLALAHGIA